MRLAALTEHDALQALALFIGRDLPRDSGVMHGGHVNQKPARQRDVAGDARAFLGDGLFGNLDQNFLAFFQQITYDRLLPWSKLSWTPAHAPSRTAVLAVPAPVGALLVSGGAGRSPPLPPPPFRPFRFRPAFH